MTKRCPKCDRTFENAVNFFPKNRSRKDGLGSWCFKCTNDASREDHQNYRADPKNKEHEAAFAKEYNSRPESKQKRKKNRARPEVKAKEAEAKKAYRATPEGKIVTAAYVKTRREDPIAAAIDKAARRIARQKDNLSPEALAWREDYRKENKERLKNQAQARHRWFKEQAINAYGGKCTCCGEDKIEFLAIDHVNNDGHIHRKQEPGAIGGNIYRWLAKNDYPQDGRFQVLCHNCNQSKELYGACPHKGPVRWPVSRAPKHRRAKEDQLLLFPS